MSEREQFLQTHGWSIISTVGQDSSIRRYFRLRKGEQTAILMETVPDHSPQSTPGHSIADFVRISKWLNEIGANAPDIYAIDAERGLLILEDFGGICFKYAVLSGENAHDLYDVAAKTLEHIAAQNCPLDLPQYYDSHVHLRHRRIIDYYLPLLRGQANEAGLVEAYRSVWAGIEGTLPLCPQTFVHVDYHAENLMYLPKEGGVKRCGILDFQGAMIGPAPYDLANLLEDARADIPADIKAAILDAKDENFRAWYRILATQFHCRVIGQFIKMAAMDGNDSYLKHIPRLQSYLIEGLKDPLLVPLAQFFKENDIVFNKEIPEVLDTLKPLIAADAY
ncbi:MAG: aminoglycoside phosphotransferase family protein [Alphaproteobacteria bacterium]